MSKNLRIELKYTDGEVVYGEFRGSGLGSGLGIDIQRSGTIESVRIVGTQPETHYCRTVSAQVTLRRGDMLVVNTPQDYYTLVRMLCPDTATPVVASTPVTYGATCKRCNEFNPHAEARTDFICYGCR